MASDCDLSSATLQIRQVGDWGQICWDDVDVGGGGERDKLRVMFSGMMDEALPTVLARATYSTHIHVCVLEAGFLTLAARVCNDQGVLFQKKF